MSEHERYTSAKAVESAIASAARTATAADPSLTVQERIRLEYFNRFLSRVFSESAGSDWMLKGGTSMLARVPNARSTTDVDLYRANQTIDAALADLRRLAAIDLGDFLRFEYTGHRNAVGGEQQTYTEGYSVHFDVYVGAKLKDQLRVDLVVNVPTTDVPDIALPANALPLPKLPSYPYRLYPVVDQIADKVCATLTLYSGHRSSRVKDLVDLVVLAVSQDVDAAKLLRALQVEALSRGLDLPTCFVIPGGWGPQYAKLAAPLPACEEFRDAESAAALVGGFLDPVLSDAVAGKTWSHRHRTWL